MMDIYDNAPGVNRMLVEAGRLGIFSFVMGLWADYNPQDRTTWPTVNRLKGQIDRCGLASSRHIDDVLAWLAATDYIVLQRIADDRRVRLLKPTERMITQDYRMILPFFRALDLLFGGARYALFLERYRACQRVRQKVTTAIFPWATSLLPQNRDLTIFFDRTCAIQILFKLVALDATRSEHAARETSLVEFGTRLGMSRTHVRNILRDAEEAGLMVRSRRDGVFHHLTPDCVTAFDRFVANALSLVDRACLLTTPS
ncbi:hypothetical protein ASF22_21550 [Methylobacterium sp. Leaf87]|nr:hypothetical protein ASF22_21550 [Methylobacterium sp. Leaf87]